MEDETSGEVSQTKYYEQNTTLPMISSSGSKKGQTEDDYLDRLGQQTIQFKDDETAPKHQYYQTQDIRTAAAQFNDGAPEYLSSTKNS